MIKVDRRIRKIFGVGRGIRECTEGEVVSFKLQETQ